MKINKQFKQLKLLKDLSKAYGGELMKTREGRAHGRPLDTRNTMHLVLRSTKAIGDWSFKKKTNEVKISHLAQRFSKRYGVRVLSLANVGNHLHFHIKLSSRHTYAAFIRALTGAIAMAVTSTSRWNKLKTEAKDKFWDYRPFTRVVESFRGFLNLRHYLRINELEGMGSSRIEARFILARLDST